MQPNGLKGQKLYSHSGRHSPRQESNQLGPHQDSPSRHRGFFDLRGRDPMEGTTSRPYPSQSSGGLGETHPRPKGTQWMEYFSAEHGHMMKYNPVTGETCSAAESTGPSQTDTKPFLPVGGSVSDVRRVRESMERPAISVLSPLVGDEKGKKPAHDDDHPGRNRFPPSSDNPRAGAPPVPSSLSASDTPNRITVQPRSFPNPATGMDEMDRPATVRDMERFTGAIQATIREMGLQLVKAIADLHRQGGGSVDSSEDE